MSSVVQRSVDPATKTVFRAKKKNRLGKHSFEFSKRHYSNDCRRHSSNFIANFEQEFTNWKNSHCYLTTT